MRLLGAGLRPRREGSDPAGATQGSPLTLGAHVPLGGGGAHRGFVPTPAHRRPGPDQREAPAAEPSAWALGAAGAKALRHL